MRWIAITFTTAGCRVLSAALTLMVLGTGCNQIQLRGTSIRQARTVADLQCQQVLDNLAMFVANPQTLPSYALVDQGAVLVDSTATAGVNVIWNPYTLMTWAFTPSGVRHSSGNWVMKPIGNPVRLEAMRFVYQVATAGQYVSDGSAVCTSCDKALKPFGITCNDYCKIPPPGWFQCGKRCDVPHSARYVGNYDHLYVWVPPEGEDSLARLSLTMLQIAMAPIGPPPAPTPGGKSTQSGEVGPEEIMPPKEDPGLRAMSDEELLQEARTLVRERDRALQMNRPVQIYIQPQTQESTSIESLVPAYGQPTTPGRPMQ